MFVLVGEKDVKRVPCKLCDQQLADGGGTKNLLSHLQAKHPEEYKRCTDHAETIMLASLKLEQFVEEWVR